MEVWKIIKGCDNYKVSNMGNVIGLEIVTNFGNNIKVYPERIINPWKDKKGYKYVDISMYPKRKRFLLHRLVALHFLENPLNLPQINHIDGIKSNNKVSNLEWCTSKHNINHAIKNGLNRNLGINNYKSNLTKKDIFNIRKSSKKQAEIAKQYNISQTTVSRIKNFKTYKNIK